MENTYPGIFYAVCINNDCADASILGSLLLILNINFLLREIAVAKVISKYFIYLLSAFIVLMKGSLHEKIK